MRDFLRKLFTGRYGSYGTDELTRFFLRAAIVLLVLSLIIEPLWFLYFGTIIMLALCYFRLFSRNITKRTRENDIYKRQIRKLNSFFKRKDR